MSKGIVAADYAAVADGLLKSADRFLESKAKGSAGNYRRNCARALRAFFEYLDCEDMSPPNAVDDVDEAHFRRFARYLAVDGWLDAEREPLPEDGTTFNRQISASTKRTYYSMISAWCGWCVREGVLPTHYAVRDAAREPLPDGDDGSVRDQQTWSQHQRDTITRYADHCVDRALDDVDRAADAVKELRDRAFVYVLAYTGVRGGEVLRWPVFPSLAWRLLYEHLRSGAPGRLSEQAVEQRLEDADGRADLFDLFREWDVVPPAMNTTSGRNVMKRLCDDLAEDDDFAGELDFTGSKHDYLAPHGARRGVGKVLVKQRGYDRAAEQLDNTPSVVQEHYSHIKAPERSADVGAAFDEEGEK